MIGKQLAASMLDAVPCASEALYWEPFCGMLGVGVHMASAVQQAVFSDVQEDLVMMWQAALGGWIPPRHVSRELWDELKTADPSALRGFVGHSHAFLGQFFSGYKPKLFTTSKRLCSDVHSDMIANKYVPKLAGAKFIHGDYAALTEHVLALAAGGPLIVYADPPYATNGKNKSKESSYVCRNFCTTAMWDWVRELQRRPNTWVFVSEITAPEDMEVLWRTDMSHRAKAVVHKTHATGIRRVDCLYRPVHHPPP